MTFAARYSIFSHEFSELSQILKLFSLFFS
jgi:hypothetical protein